MKTRISLVGMLTLVLGVMTFTVGCAQTAAQPAAVTNRVETQAVATPPINEATPAQPAVASTPEPAATTEKLAPVKPVVEEPPPANLKISPALNEVIKMTKSGVGKEVLMAYINESSQRFDLGADEIIYLNDLGVADEVTTAMIDRDRMLRGVAEAAAPVPDASANATLYAPQYQAAPTAAAAPAPQPAPVETVATPDSDAAYFYDALAPYGSWVSVPDYGLCWQPTVMVTTPSWRPYLDCGRWVWSDCGWYWLSDYSWGWAPFHYGRWYYHGHHGWVWRPGRTWGPAWVSWRYSDAYCGWAPLPPEAGYVYGVGFTWYGSGVSMDFEFGLGWSSYSFLPVASFCDYSPRGHVVHHDRGHDAWRHSKVVNKVKIKGDNNVVTVNGGRESRVRVKGDNNTVIFEGGADPARVETASRAPVHRVRIKEAEGDSLRTRRPDRIEREGSEFVVYKPTLPATASERARTAVAKVAANPERLSDRARNEGGRREREPANLKASDARNAMLAETRRPATVAVAPPAPKPATAPVRVNLSEIARERDKGKGNNQTGPEGTAATVARPREVQRSQATAVRTPDSLVIRGNNDASARNTATATRSGSIQTQPNRTPPAAPKVVAPQQRSRATDQPKAEAPRSSDARANRATPNVSARTPTPVTKATPISEPFQRERVQPIRVWNSPSPQPVAQPNQQNQPNANRNNSALNSPNRSYTPTPAAPTLDSSRQDRNPGRNEIRVERSPAISAPAPAPVRAPTYSPPEQSRSESARAERDRGGDNISRGNNDRGGNNGGGGGGGGGGNNGGGGGGGGGGDRNDGGNRSSGRNR